MEDDQGIVIYSESFARFKLQPTVYNFIIFCLKVLWQNGVHEDKVHYVEKNKTRSSDETYGSSSSPQPLILGPVTSVPTKTMTILVICLTTIHIDPLWLGPNQSGMSSVSVCTVVLRKTSNPSQYILYHFILYPLDMTAKDGGLIFLKQT